MGFDGRSLHCTKTHRYYCRWVQYRDISLKILFYNEKIIQKKYLGSFDYIFHFYSIRSKFGATTKDQKTGYVEIDSEIIILHEKYATEVEDRYIWNIGLIKLKRGMTDFRKF